MKYSRNYILECSVDRLRLVTPFWSRAMILEALRKIRATWKVHGKKIDGKAMLDLLRKEQVIRNELSIRMKRRGVSKVELHDIQERLIGHNPGEQEMNV